MNQNFVDLHLHTCHSDGRFSRAQLIQMADTFGITAMAFTDHDCLFEEDPEPYQQLTQNRVTLVRGVELSTTYRTRSGRRVPVHVIALMYDQEAPELRNIVTWNQSLDNSRYIQEVIQKLSHCGLEIDSWEILSRRYGRRIEKIDLARELSARNGLTIDEVYDQYLSRKGKAYVMNTLDYAPMEWAVTATIHSHGIPVLCHPYNINVSEPELEELIEDFRNAAQDFPAAMEIYYRNYNAAQCARLAAYAQTFHLLPSCGSDLHGNGTKDRFHPFPHSIYQTLQQAHDKAFSSVL